ncbi:unnamed protein product [Albugo candida]|uniref:Guanylate cyclase domain-containing protein n=1 Tax=Albugo candida TaxID=65357 RepID=A0A024G5H5_9STRA|nr:unnamed protein product [Albugo candida]|eukprot:CCI41570.1 unnamed protein product [Albugo candida]
MLQFIDTRAKDAIYEQNEWFYAFLVSSFLSAISTLSAFCHMRQLKGDILRSSVRFVMLCSLSASALSSTAAFLFYMKIIIKTRESNTQSNETSTIELIILQERGGCNLLSTFLLVFYNISYILTTYWILVVARELFKLASVTIDRGEKSERAAIKIYSGLALLLLGVVSAASCTSILLEKKTHSYMRLMIAEQVCTILAILSLTVLLIDLKRRGRKFEHLHGVATASPLYHRLKLILLVYIIFTLPYCTIQIQLLLLDQVKTFTVPNTLSHIAMILHYFFGAALAFVMSASQECCFIAIRPILPARVKASARFQYVVDSVLSGQSGIIFQNGEHTPIDPPTQPVFVFTDIEGSSELWSMAPEGVIDQAQQIHDDILRGNLLLYKGYEITTAGDAFYLAFHTIDDAINYCFAVQFELLKAKWPKSLQNSTTSTRTIRKASLKQTLLFRGLRVRMGVHDANEKVEGKVVIHQHPVTGKTNYMGFSEMIAQEVGDTGYGGQIVVSKRVAVWLGANPLTIKNPFKCEFLSMRTVSHLDLSLELYELVPKVLEARQAFFAQCASQKRLAENGDSHDYFTISLTDRMTSSDPQVG